MKKTKQLISPILQTMQAIFQKEIANNFTLNANQIKLTLPNHTNVTITAQSLNESAQIPNDIQTHTSQHTFHYLHQHDFDASRQQLDYLVLNNLEECRAYVDDICRTLLHATVHDFEVTFSNNAKYLIQIELN